MHILPSNPALHYMGRIDRKQPDAPVFYWAGSLVSFGFTGDFLAVTIENHRNYNVSRIGYILDGKEDQLVLDDAQDIPIRYEIPVKTGGRHSFTLFKRQDDPHYYTIRNIELAEHGSVYAENRKSKLKLEFYGDSVTAGAVCEALENVGKPDPPVYDSSMDNAWHSFAMQTARLLSADVHLTAQGGIALLDKSGYFNNGKYGMETAYNKLCYLDCAPQMSDWDFSLYHPDFVIFAIGQNDHHYENMDNQIPSPERKAIWIKTYVNIIRDLMQKYPRAKFILTLTILGHDSFWEELLDECSEILADTRVIRFRFTRTGKGTCGHPRIPEHCEMACELTEHILSLLDA